MKSGIYITAAVLGLFAGSGWYFFPIEIQELMTERELVQGGVKSGWIERLHFYERDDCDDHVELLFHECSPSFFSLGPKPSPGGAR